ncbi:MAG: NAD(P)/FAD-dependent oxidoreductase [Bacteroidota bacterium]
MESTYPVVIIGAGAAGIYAGYLLAQAGVDFRILEASDRVGGRLGKLEGFADYPLDLGAEWLHGKKSLVGKLVKRTHTHITKDKSKERYWFKGELVKKLPVDVWDVFEQADLPDVSYAAYAQQQSLYPKYEYLVEAVAGDFGAAADQLSAYGKIWEERHWSSGNQDYKFARTYFDLIYEQWATPILDRIRLNTVISKIDYRGDEIRTVDVSGKIQFAHRVIITVPLPILQDGDIEFLPPLPSEKVAAFQKIGMGPGMKVFLKFSSTFYHPNVFGGPVCAAYASEQTGKQGDDSVLMAFAMGQQATKLTALGSDQAVVAALLDELDQMYAGQASQAFLAAKVIDWGAMPFIRGAYSYSTVGIGKARALAAQPIENRLFFAGEAMNLQGHHQTVQGAVETGEKAVIQLLASLA